MIVLHIVNLKEKFQPMKTALLFVMTQLTMIWICFIQQHQTILNPDIFVILQQAMIAGLRILTRAATGLQSVLMAVAVNARWMMSSQEKKIAQMGLIMTGTVSMTPVILF